MKKLVIFFVVATVFLVFIFFGLKAPSQHKAAVATGPVYTEPNVYINTMLSLAGNARNIGAGKFIYRNKSVIFISRKKDAYGSEIATNYYSAEKNALEQVRVKYLALVPSPECAAAHKIFGEALDNSIASFNKTVESLNKDDSAIMDKEGAPLARKAQDLLSLAIQKLQDIKMRHGIK